MKEDQGRKVIEGVARRILRESQKPHNRTMTPEEARKKAAEVRLRKERDGQ